MEISFSSFSLTCFKEETIGTSISSLPLFNEVLLSLLELFGEERACGEDNGDVVVDGDDADNDVAKLTHAGTSKSGLCQE